MSEAVASPASQVGARGLVAAALALGTFMQVLDTTIANVSIPTIAGDLGVSADQETWVITSFAVANGICVPLTGWLMQRFGVVRVFVLSVLLFTAASFPLRHILEPDFADRVPRVAGGRIRADDSGVASVAAVPVPPTEGRHRAGDLVDDDPGGTSLRAHRGRLYFDNYAWPWIFYINVPVGILCAFVCWQGLKHRETPTRKLPVDVIGLRVADRLGGLAADPARHRQGCRLVLLWHYCRAGDHRVGWFRRVPCLGIG
ncbi:MAG: MFS transporter [Halioglobus sp.]